MSVHGWRDGQDDYDEVGSSFRKGTKRKPNVDDVSRHDGGAGEDLFLSLALNEADLNGPSISMSSRFLNATRSRTPRL